METYTQFRPDHSIESIIDASIQDYGYILISVPSVAHRPGWTYSLGLFSSFRHPELIVVGFPEKAIRQALRDGIELIKSGTILKPNTRYSEDEGIGYDLKTYTLPSAWRPSLFGGCFDHFSGEDTPVLALMFPNECGKFPNEWDYVQPSGVKQIDLRAVRPPQAYRARGAELRQGEPHISEFTFENHRNLPPPPVSDGD